MKEAKTMNWNRKKQAKSTGQACQLRSGGVHPYSALKGYVPGSIHEDMIYRQIREAIPVLDAAIG